MPDGKKPGPPERFDVQLDPATRTAEVTRQAGLLLPVKMRVPYAVLKGAAAAIISQEVAAEVAHQGGIERAPHPIPDRRAEG